LYYARCLSIPFEPIRSQGPIVVWKNQPFPFHPYMNRIDYATALRRLDFRDKMRAPAML